VLRVALIGAGDAGRHHARALAALHAAGEVAWTALGARDLAKGTGQRGELALPDSARVCSPDDAIAASDAVIIATPDGSHRANAEQVLAAGKHVLVEKPLALSLADAEAVVAAACAADRVLAVGYHLRHHAGHARVKAELAQLVGTPRTIFVRWAWPDPARAGWRAHGQGARWWSLAALGTHAIDLALWFANDRVVEVAAVTMPDAGVDHAAEVSLRFAGGVLAHVSCAITYRAEPIIAVAGDAGEIVCTHTLGARGAGALQYNGGELAFTAEDPYLRQLRAFVRRCAGSGPRVDPDAIANVEVLERISSS
jgi:predicted dehydrogenase